MCQCDIWGWDECVGVVVVVGLRKLLLVRILLERVKPSEFSTEGPLEGENPVLNWEWEREEESKGFYVVK